MDIEKSLVSQEVAEVAVAVAVEAANMNESDLKECNTLPDQQNKQQEERQKDQEEQNQQPITINDKITDRDVGSECDGGGGGGGGDDGDADVEDKINDDNDIVSLTMNNEEILIEKTELTLQEQEEKLIAITSNVTSSAVEQDQQNPAKIDVINVNDNINNIPKKDLNYLESIEQEDDELMRKLEEIEGGGSGGGSSSTYTEPTEEEENNLLADDNKCFEATSSSSISVNLPNSITTIASAVEAKETSDLLKDLEGEDNDTPKLYDDIEVPSSSTNDKFINNLNTDDVNMDTTEQPKEVDEQGTDVLPPPTLLMENKNVFQVVDDDENAAAVKSICPNDMTNENDVEMSDDNDYFNENIIDSTEPNGKRQEEQIDEHEETSITNLRENICEDDQADDDITIGSSETKSAEEHISSASCSNSSTTNLIITKQNDIIIDETMSSNNEPEKINEMLEISDDIEMKNIEDVTYDNNEGNEALVSTSSTGISKTEATEDNESSQISSSDISQKQNEQQQSSGTVVQTNDQNKPEVSLDQIKNNETVDKTDDIDKKSTDRQNEILPKNIDEKDNVSSNTDDNITVTFSKKNESEPDSSSIVKISVDITSEHIKPNEIESQSSNDGKHNFSTESLSGMSQLDYELSTTTTDVEKHLDNNVVEMDTDNDSMSKAKEKSDIIKIENKHLKNISNGSSVNGSSGSINTNSSFNILPDTEDARKMVKSLDFEQNLSTGTDTDTGTCTTIESETTANLKHFTNELQNINGTTEEEEEKHDNKNQQDNVKIISPPNQDNKSSIDTTSTDSTTTPIKNENIINSSTTTTSTLKDTEKKSIEKQLPELSNLLFINGLDAGNTSFTEDNIYDINVLYEQDQLKLLSIERVDDKKKILSFDSSTIDSTGKALSSSSSSGSVFSTGLFSIPSVTAKTVSSSSSLSSSVSINIAGNSNNNSNISGTISDQKLTEDGKFLIPSSSQQQQQQQQQLQQHNLQKCTIKGVYGLCNFMIEHFKRIKKSINVDGNDTDDTNDNDVENFVKSKKNSSILMKKDKGKKLLPNVKAGKKTIISQKSSTTVRAGKKRKLETYDDDDDDDDEPNVKQSKSKKTKTNNSSNNNSTNNSLSTTPTSSTVKLNESTGSTPGTPSGSIGVNISNINSTSVDEGEQYVLARWIDKKFYPGRVIGRKPSNKYLILFVDGQTKAIQQDYIIFGNDDGTLPIKEQYVHVKVENQSDTFEPGLVTEITIEDDDSVKYTVVTETTTVMVTLNDIYLEDDQGKAILELTKKNAVPMSPVQITPKRAGRPSTKLEYNKGNTSVLSATMDTGPLVGQRGRGKKSISTTPTNTPSSSTVEPGVSGITTTPTSGGRKGRRTKRINNPQPLLRISESDFSDIDEKNSMNISDSDTVIEAVNGVQPELQRSPNEAKIIKIGIITDYLANDKSKDISDILGPVRSSKLFHNKCFILTCTLVSKKLKEKDSGKKQSNAQYNQLCNKYTRFSTLPFYKEYLEKQIVAGGGVVYGHFEDIPLNKYKQCKLIAAHPCVTAKYVQCLAAQILPISHEWIIKCCQQNTLVDQKSYILPTGWSIIDNCYKLWTIGKRKTCRDSVIPMRKKIIIVASLQKDFVEFWSRVCKLAGATVRLVKSLSDVTSTTTGFMLTDEEFPIDIKSKAEHFHIPIVSSVWIVQSLIMGRICDPDAHVKLKQTYHDDDDDDY